MKEEYNDTEHTREVLLNAVKPFQAGYKQEVLAVQRLGEQIGYGNMMAIASALWRIKLEDEWGISSGAFIPTISSFMKKKEAEKAVKEQEARAESFREILR